MKILLYEVGKPGKVVNVWNELESLQGVVGGWIETVTYPEGFVLICNEDGRYLPKCRPNRSVKLPDGRFELIHGDFFFCGIDGDELTDVPEDLEVSEWLMN